MTTATAVPPRVVWTEEKVQAAIVEFLFKQDAPQTFYQIREGTGIDAYGIDHPGVENIAVFPSLAKLRAEHKIWRQDMKNEGDGQYVRYALSLSTWLKMAERHQAAKRALKGRRHEEGTAAELRR